jgi:hypothetical protein
MKKVRAARSGRARAAWRGGPGLGRGDGRGRPPGAVGMCRVLEDGTRLHGLVYPPPSIEQQKANYKRHTV